MKYVWLLVGGPILKICQPLSPCRTTLVTMSLSIIIFPLWKLELPHSSTLPHAGAMGVSGSHSGKKPPTKTQVTANMIYLHQVSSLFVYSLTAEDCCYRTTSLHAPVSDFGHNAFQCAIEVYFGITLHAVCNTIKKFCCR